MGIRVRADDGGRDRDSNTLEETLTHLKRTTPKEYLYRSAKFGPALEITVAYYTGFSLSTRGIWFHLRQVVISTDSYAVSLAAGVREMLAPTERAKPNVLLAMAERIDPIVPAIVAAWGPEPTEHGDAAAVLALVRQAFELEVAH